MRKETTVTISAEGRDKGKKFLLREMPAAQAEAWATRAFLALAHSGVNVPDDVKGLGLEGLFRLGLSALSNISYDEMRPLLDEMFGCVNIVEHHVTRPPTDDDIEEIATRLLLRKEVLDLHVNFSSGGGLSISTATPTPTSHQPSTSMSQVSSARPSRAGSRR